MTLHGPGTPEKGDRNVDEDLKEYVVVYKKALSNDRETNWVRAEIADIIISSGSQEALSEFLHETGEAKGTLFQYGWVWGKFRESKNRDLPGMVWSHYRAAAGTDDPDTWIQRAFDGSWSISQLKIAIAEAKADNKIDAGLVCATCKGEIPKENKVSITHRKVKAICCGRECGIKWLQDFKE